MSGKLLAIDVGNSKTAVAVFAGERLASTWQVPTRAAASAEDLEAEHGPHLGLQDLSGAPVVVACVVPEVEPALAGFLARLGLARPLWVDHRCDTGLTLAVEHPETLGADRIVNAVAGFAWARGACVVVGLGTATTVDAITVEGTFLGGAIAPGLGICAEALFARGARLPRVPLVKPATAVGRSTVEAIQAGLFWGHVGQTRELVSRARARLGGEASVIATGGLAPLLAPEVADIASWDPHLTLTGLRIVHERAARGG